MSDMDRIREYQQNAVNMNSQFKFDCKMCGACCKNRDEPIIINGVDIFYASKELGIKPSDFLPKHTTYHIGANSRLPVAILREDEQGKCSLMVNNKCSVHQNKPAVCGMYPLGRMLGIGDEFTYFTQPNKCPGCFSNKKQTVKEWLQKHNIISKEAEAKAWNELAIFLTTKLRENDITPEPGDVLSIFLLVMLYIGYDTSVPLLPQIEENIERAKRMFETADSENDS